MPRALPRLILPAFLIAFAPPPGAQQQSTADPRGFTAQSARTQREWEGKFRAIPDPTRQREYMHRLAAHPHHVGSPYGKQNAEYMRELFSSWGWDAKIEEYSVLFPTPKTRRLELLGTGAARYVAKLEEPALREDPTTNQRSEQLPSYNAFSGDGDVTASLVYVNYGIPADYEELDRRGISVKGAIVIARYGGSWRGIKPKVAAEHGAIGCLIFSDPRDDGYFQGDVYPKGPWRPKDGVQRGSVLDMPVAPGDPLTIGVGATRDAHRIDRKDAPTIMKIPVLPISYEDAQPLLAALGGEMAPEGWRGALPLPYHLGPSTTKVHLLLEHDWKQTPVYDVVATLRGQTSPDEWIVRGNHHDGWVNGAQDPLAGMVAELEEARALGELYRQGWRPNRTIVYTAWDAEEPALLGSTEWAEDHGKELQQKAVAYINTDGNGRGYFGAGGSHTLEKFINEVARDIEDPETKLSAWKRAQAAQILNGGPAQRREARERPDLRIGALGSGSDFTPFVQHLGIASLNLGFGGEDGGGIYHSIYDTYTWFERFGDTSYVYGKALSQTVGTAVMRLADADVLPYNFTNLAETVRGYVGEVKTLRDDMATRTAERNRQVEEGVFSATTDPKQPMKLPVAEPVPPYLEFSVLDNAVDSLSHAASRYEEALGAALKRGLPAAATLARANDMLRATEQLLTSEDGLPKRPWYRHLLYAPGLYTGYGVKTLPGAREAIELKEWDVAGREMHRIAAALERTAAQIDSAAGMLGGK